jgi:hypothetical protein
MRHVSTHASTSCEFLTCILHEYAHKANTVCIIVIHVQRQEFSVFLAYKRREFSQISGIRLHMSSCGGNQKSFAALAARVLTREEPGVAGFEGRARRGGFQCLIFSISGDAARVNTCECRLRVSHMYTTRVCA